MKHKYSNILEPIRIGNVVLKNHLLATKCISQELQGPENFPAEGTIKFVEDLARNGAAVVVCTIGSFPETRGKTMFWSEFDMDNNKTIRYFHQMAERVHAHNSLAIGALSTAIPQDVAISEKRHPEWIKKPLPGPLGDFGPDGRPNPPKPEMSKERIDQFVKDFAKDCAWIKTLGFDGVNVYMCYEGSLLAHALSPVLNQRVDEYGGSTENRARLATELFREIRKTCGRDFLIECQISGEEDLPDGYTLDEFLDYCEIWAKEGLVDIFEVRAKNGELHHTSAFSSPEHEPTTLKYAKAFKERKIPALVAPSGGFQNLDDIESFIANGDTDMVAMARAFIADSEYGEKLVDGKNDWVPCIRCDKCHGAVCSVNPHIGRRHLEGEMFTEPKRVKKVAVIGGGPAGMKAALVAAERGHEVTLYEKSDALGGQLKHADYVSWKYGLKNYKDYLIDQIEKSSVCVKLGTEIAPDALAEEKPDAVIAACGALPKTAPVPGADDARIFAPIDVFGKEEILGKKVVVIGGASAGTETAAYLAEKGHEVTLVSRKPMIDYDNVAHGAAVFTEYLHTLPNLTIITSANTLKIEDASRVTIEVSESAGQGPMHGPFMPDKDDVANVGEHPVCKTLEADSIVFSAGVSPCVEACYAYASVAPEFFVIGDANVHTNDMWKRFMLPDKAPHVGGDVKHATRTAYDAAMSL